MRDIRTHRRHADLPHTVVRIPIAPTIFKVPGKLGNLLDQLNIVNIPAGALIIIIIIRMIKGYPHLLSGIRTNIYTFWRPNSRFSIPYGATDIRPSCRPTCGLIVHLYLHIAVIAARIGKPVPEMKVQLFITGDRIKPERRADEPAVCIARIITFTHCCCAKIASVGAIRSYITLFGHTYLPNTVVCRPVGGNASFKVFTDDDHLGIRSWNSNKKNCKTYNSPKKLVSPHS